MVSVRKEIETVKTTVNSINRKVEEGLGNQNSSVFKEIRERDNRKTNVVFHNIPEPKGRTKEERIQEDLCRVINAPVTMQEDARFTTRLGKFSKEGCHPVLVGFQDTAVKDRILDNARNLGRQGDDSQ